MKILLKSLQPDFSPDAFYLLQVSNLLPKVYTPSVLRVNLWHGKVSAYKDGKADGGIFRLLYFAGN